MDLTKDQLQELIKQRQKRNTTAEHFLKNIKHTRHKGKRIQGKMKDEAEANKLLEDNLGIYSQI